jgi:translation initiation factor 2-alpha kinase 4
LATSSLAAVDPSDVSPHAVTLEADMTLGIVITSLGNFLVSSFFKEVGTRLYIAPEVQSRKRGPRNHSKADMYSLGVRLFRVSLSILIELYSTYIYFSDCILRDELCFFDWG